MDLFRKIDKKIRSRLRKDRANKEAREFLSILVCGPSRKVTVLTTLHGGNDGRMAGK